MKPKCAWEAIAPNECPDNSNLAPCTHDMKDGELCEADNPLSEGLDKSAMDLNNCQPGNWDVFRCNKK